MNKKIKGGYFEYDSIILHLIVFFKSSVVNLNDLFFFWKDSKDGRFNFITCDIFL